MLSLPDMRLIRGQVQIMEPPSVKNGVLFMGEYMIQGHFYFLKEKFFEDFPDENIQRNHEVVNGAFEAVLIKAAIGVLAKQRRGIRLVFHDILTMEGILIERS